LFDGHFTIDHVRSAVVELRITGAGNYSLHGESSMSQISRDPLELVRQAISEHQYPDGFALFLGTMFAPIQDRDEAGHGFTHKQGDLVRISTPRLGVLENRVTTSTAAPPWDFGLYDLMTNLSRRGLLAPTGAA
jgi:fumarylacetoacetate (FAA) hydrolase family protein